MRKRFVLLVALMTVTLGSLLTGCSGGRNTRQEEYRAQGMKYMQEMDYEKAINAFQKGLSESVGKIRDEEYDLCFLKAKALYLNGEKEEALAVYNKIIDYRDCAQAHYFRGNYYYAEGNEAAALEDYKKAIELDDTNYDLYISVYDSLMAHNQKELAESYLKTALEAEGRKACSDMNKGRIYYALHDDKLALEYLLKADEAGDKEACYYIALIYMQEDEKKADEFFQKFLKTDYATNDRLFEMGKLAMDKGEYKEALVYLEAAQKQKGMLDDQILKKHLICCYERVGEYGKAKSLLKEYVEDYPEDEEASRELVFLETR